MGQVLQFLMVLVILTGIIPSSRSLAGYKNKPVVDHYKVEQDDTLNTISIRLYGTTRYGAWMFLWNKKQLRNMDDLRVGMVLKLKRKRVFSIEAGNTQLLYYYRKKFGLEGPPRIAHASIGTIQELPTAVEIPMATAETTKVIEEDKKSLIENDPATEAVLRGEEYLKSNNLPKAKVKFAEARAEDPSNPTPRILEISTLLQMGNQTEASFRARELVKQDKEYCGLPVIQRLAEGDCE